MVKNSNNLWLVVIIAIVVAVAASLITVNLTGDVIRQKNDLFGTYKVYTISEVDAKLKGLTTNEGVLDILNNKCNVVDGANSGITNPEDYSCQKVCAQKELKCIFGIGTFKVTNSSLGDQKVVVRSCQDRTSPINTYLSCMCCNSS